MTRADRRGAHRPTFTPGDRIPLPMSGSAVEVLELGPCDRPSCLCRDAADAGIDVVHYREVPESEVP